MEESKPSAEMQSMYSAAISVWARGRKKREREEKIGKERMRKRETRSERENEFWE